MSIETARIVKRKHRTQSEDPSLVRLRDRALIRAMISSREFGLSPLDAPSRRHDADHVA